LTTGKDPVPAPSGEGRPDPPARIVCLTEEPTEILYALGEGARVVGISAWTVRPPEARERHPIVSGFTGGNLERIVGLEPDLVVGFSDIQARLASQLIERGLDVLIFNQRSLEEILDVVLLLGRIVGRPERARDLVRGYRERLAAARARGARRPFRPRVYFEEWPDPMISAIRWVSELIEVAGGEDVFADRSRGKSAKERFVKPEEVVARDPQVLLASWCGKPVDADEIARRPGFGGVAALRSGEVHEIESVLVLQPGPACLTDGLARIESLLDRVAPPGPAPPR
jgi:iron complex transport system substrate-binding protein